MHPVSHPALHALPPLFEQPLLTVQAAAHLASFMAAATEACKAQEQQACHSAEMSICSYEKYHQKHSSALPSLLSFCDTDKQERSCPAHVLLAR